LQRLILQSTVEEGLPRCALSDRIAAHRDRLDAGWHGSLVPFSGSYLRLHTTSWVCSGCFVMLESVLGPTRSSSRTTLKRFCFASTGCVRSCLSSLRGCMGTSFVGNGVINILVP